MRCRSKNGAGELAQALRATPSSAAFADVVALLDAANAAEFDLSTATAAERLEAWPDERRAAPGEDWRRAQTGALRASRSATSR